MSLAVLADHMASQGRNGDTMLVHMAPDEVAGLHALALAHGKSLTINPETGLPEAFSLRGLLKSLLPAIAGFALGPAGFGLMSAMQAGLTVGAVTGLAKGSLKEGIMAGLGAYGGANLGAAFTGAESAGATTAAAEAAKAASQEAVQQGLTGEAANQFAQQAATKAYTDFAAQPMLDQAAGSFTALKNAPGAMGGLPSLAKPAMYAAAPMAEQMLVPPNVQMPKLPQYPGFFRPSGGFDPYTGTYLPAEPIPVRAASGGIVALADGGLTDPTQRATPTAPQLAAQQSILADPVKAAREAALSGIAAGMTNQQIADMVNMQYGKTFNAQNVADFMRAQGLTRPAPAVTSPVVTPPVVTPPVVPPTTSRDSVTYGGDTTTPTYTPVTTQPTYGEPFQPVAQTMEQVRSGYEKGGGSTAMPTITDIKPTDRTYSQNQAFDLLRNYLQTNPNAQYQDVVSFANTRGIPEVQARAAYNELRFGSMTGGSKAAYDYLMGRGAYPVKPFTPTGEIMRPYAESVLGAPENLRAKRYIFDPATQKYKLNPDYVPFVSAAATASATPRDQAGNLITGNAKSYFVANPDVYQRWLQGDTGMNAGDYALYHWMNMGRKEGRKGWIEEPTGAGAGTGAGTGGTDQTGESAGLNRRTALSAARSASTSSTESPTAFSAMRAATPTAAPAYAPSEARQGVSSAVSAERVGAGNIEDRLRQETRGVGINQMPANFALYALRRPEAISEVFTPDELKKIGNIAPERLAALAGVKAAVTGYAMPKELLSYLAQNGPQDPVQLMTFAQGLMGFDPNASYVSRYSDFQGRQIMGPETWNRLKSEYEQFLPAFKTINPDYKVVGPAGYVPQDRAPAAGVRDAPGVVGGMNVSAADYPYYSTQAPKSEAELAGVLGQRGFYRTPGDAQQAGELNYIYKYKEPVKGARGGLMDIAAAAAHGGNVQQYNLGGYSDGGRLLRGPGDGVSDSIPATIGNRQPARLADGEFVIPARIVSEIGNGSTEAGARKLYKMMDRVQRARAKTTGKGRVAKDTKAEQYLPA